MPKENILTQSVSIGLGSNIYEIKRPNNRKKDVLFEWLDSAIAKVDKFKEEKERVEKDLSEAKVEYEKAQEEIERQKTLLEKEREKREAAESNIKKVENATLAQLDKQRGDSLAEIEKLRAIIQESDESSLAKIEGIQRKEAQIKSLELKVSSLKSRISKEKTAESKTKIVRKLPKRPDRIDFEYRRNEMGLISMVAMKAQGYSDIVIDVVRGSNYRFKNLEIKVK